MSCEKDISAALPRKSVILSFAAALVIFLALAGVLGKMAEITSRTAVGAAERGNYGLALDRLGTIDPESDGELYKDTLYRIALAMYENGDYEDARERFAELGEYSDSADRAYLCLLRQAEGLTETGDYQAALGILKDILFVDGAKELFSDCQYRYALEQADSGEWLTAVRLLWSIRQYKDAEALAKKLAAENAGSDDVDKLIGQGTSLSPEQMQEYMLLREKREELKDGAIAVGFRHTAGLRRDGTVVSCGSNDAGQCETGAWKNVVQIAAGAYHTAALLSDGTVVACGDNTYGQCDVSGWKNVAYIAATDYNTVALFRDGSAASCGYLEFPQISGWSNITGIYTGAYAVSAVTSTGELFTTHQSYGMKEKNLISEAMATACPVGLSGLGDVIFAQDMDIGWKKATAVYGYGSMLAVIDENGAARVYDMRRGEYIDLPADRKALSIALGGTHGTVLYEDGSVCCFGRDSEGQCDTASWDLLS